MAQGRVAQQMSEAFAPDQAVPEMGMAVMARAAIGGRIVEVDHRQALQSDQPIEVEQEIVDGFRVGYVVAGTPKMRRVQAHGQLSVHAPSPGRVEDHRQLLDCGPDAGPAAGRVLQYEQCRLGLIVGTEEPIRGALQTVRNPSNARLNSGASMRSRVDVHEPCPELVGVFDLVTHHRDRLREQNIVWSGQVHQVRGVDRHRSNVQLDQATPERGRLRWGLEPAPPGRRVVAEDLERRGSDLGRPFDDADKPHAHRQMGARPPAARELNACHRGALRRRRAAAWIVAAVNARIETQADTALPLHRTPSRQLRWPLRPFV